MGRWRVWRALRERPHIEFGLVDLPDGWPSALYACKGDTAAIVVDRSLTPEERHAALAHELVHDERGGSGHQPGLPPELRVLVAQEEDRVERIVAERLVPVDELARVVAVVCDLGEGVTPAVVAEHFEVPEYVAARALELLARRSA